jgi:hypothetical protein
MVKCFQENHVCIFNNNKKIKKKYCIISIKKLYFVCIMDLITSLIKSWGLGLNFKNTKKPNCLFLILKIMNLYVRCILGY